MRKISILLCVLLYQTCVWAAISGTPMFEVLPKNAVFCKTQLEFADSENLPDEQLCGTPIYKVVVCTVSRESKTYLVFGEWISTIERSSECDPAQSYNKAIEYVHK